MGYLVELNTLLGLPKSFDTSSLVVGGKYKIIKERERAFPLHVAILMVDKEWSFYGYAVAHSIIVKDQQTEIEFEVVSLFSDEDKKKYKENFLAAIKLTGEITL